MKAGAFLFRLVAACRGRRIGHSGRRRAIVLTPAWQWTDRRRTFHRQWRCAEHRALRKRRTGGVRYTNVVRREWAPSLCWHRSRSHGQRLDCFPVRTPVRNSRLFRRFRRDCLPMFGWRRHANNAGPTTAIPTLRTRRRTRIGTSCSVCLRCHGLERIRQHRQRKCRAEHHGRGKAFHRCAQRPYRRRIRWSSDRVPAPCEMRTRRIAAQ